MGRVCGTVTGPFKRSLRHLFREVAPKHNDGFVEIGKLRLAQGECRINVAVAQGSPGNSKNAIVIAVAKLLGGWGGGARPAPRPVGGTARTSLPIGGSVQDGV